MIEAQNYVFAHIKVTETVIACAKNGKRRFYLLAKRDGLWIEYRKAASVDNIADSGKLIAAFQANVYSQAIHVFETVICSPRPLAILRKHHIQPSFL